jgi:hypothetical protein
MIFTPLQNAGLLRASDYRPAHFLVAASSNEESPEEIAIPCVSATRVARVDNFAAIRCVAIPMLWLSPNDSRIQLSASADSSTSTSELDNSSADSSP